MKTIIKITSILLFLFSINISVQATLQINTILLDEVGNGAFLGIEYDRINRKKAEVLNFENKHGYFIEKVVLNSAAHKAGLQPFDYLYQIGEKEFSKNHDLSDALDYYQKGDEVTIKFIRANQKYSKTVTLGGHTDSHHEYTTDKKRGEKAFLGVSNIDGKSNYNIGGVPVNITRNSTAEKLGMESGDILTHINNYRILDWSDITMALNTMKAGDNITVQYIHNASSKTNSGTLAAREESRTMDGNILGDGFEETMERFGENMERFGERMEEWGERVEEKAEIWGEKMEEKIEKTIERHQECKTSHDHAFLGINSSSISKSKAKFLGFDNSHGSYVEGIIPNTAADKAGLEIFDYVYGIDEYRTGGEQSLGSILHKYEPESTAELVLIRKGKKITKTITFGRKADAKRNHISKCDEPFLGVRHFHDDDYGKGNVLINPVENSTAMAIGLKKGDIVRKINDYPIYDWSDVATAVDAMTPGQTIKINYERSGNMDSASGKIKAYKDTKECDGEKKEWSLNGTINGEEFNINLDDLDLDLDDINIDFNWDSDDDDNEETEPMERVDMNDVEIDMQDVSSAESNEMRSKYGVDMPVVNNLQVSQVNVFPNPSTGMFSLKFDLPQRGDTRINIFNAQGREIYSYELSDFSGTFEDNIDISQNGAGAYFLAISQNGNTMTKKVILK